MGLRAWIVTLKPANLGGGSDFFDLIEKHFLNDESEIYIEQHAWNDFLKEEPLAAKFPEECKEVQLDLTENNGCITYQFN